MDVSAFEIVPHPHLHRGHWLLKANERIPCGLWCGEFWQAISYAQWAAQDFENAEIRVYKQDGTLGERRVLKGTRDRAGSAPAHEFGAARHSPTDAQRYRRSISQVASSCLSSTSRNPENRRLQCQRRYGRKRNGSIR